MPYIGNTPAEKYAAFNVQYFTTSATDTYTLDRAVANELDIRLVINNVIQEPGSGKAYTAAGTTLTLSAATAGSDTMYCVYIGKAVQTVNPGAGSVGTTALADNAVTEAKLNVSNSPTNGYVLSAQSGAAGGLTWAVDAGGAALTGSTNNTITTVTGANAIQGEANLTFDGTDLTLGTGNIVFGTAAKGVYLGVTSATASNLLDDYEEGEFANALDIAGTTQTAYSSGRSHLKYVKIGSLVHCVGLIDTDGQTLATTGQIFVRLPFATASSGSNSWAGSRITTWFNVGGDTFTGYYYLNENDTKLETEYLNTASTYLKDGGPASVGSTSSRVFMFLNITYQTDA